jgi:4-hydroxybenzoate polyprenyltransferase
MADSTPHFLRRVAAVARITEWWRYKFAPILATCFATALLCQSSIWALSGRLLLLLLALTVAATYVSLLNDWTDRADDAAAGKANRMANKSGGQAAALLGTCLAAGAGFMAYFWHEGRAVCLLYLGTWVVYSLYSLPPFRLKGRGLAGVLADAAGAHFFPQVLAVSLVGCWAGRALPGLWVAAVGIWALSSGLRNIIWHQLSDAANDAQAGVRTFVTRVGVAPARRVAEWVAFPLELLALLLMLLMGAHLAPVVALGLYGGLVLVRLLLWNMTLVIAEPGPEPHILLNEYYEFFYPLALLFADWQQRPADGFSLAWFIGLFGYSMWPTVRILFKAAWQVASLLGVGARAYFTQR